MDHGTHFIQPKYFLEDSESESNLESASDKISFRSEGASLFFIQSIVYTISRSIDFNNIHSNSFNEILSTFSDDLLSLRLVSRVYEPNYDA